VLEKRKEYNDLISSLWIWEIMYILLWYQF
jgi:hypothetical protein